jgi:hypothetical protein
MTETHVISALRQKRAEMSGELMQAEKRIIQLRADLTALDATIRVFDPTIAPSAIRPRVKRKPPAIFRHGQFSRTVLAVLHRATAPMMAREIAQQVALDHRLETDGRAMDALVSKVRGALARQKEGTVVSERRLDATVVWRAV